MRCSFYYAGTTKAEHGKAVWTGLLNRVPAHILTQPLRWSKPQRILVSSMSDPFATGVPDDWIDPIVAIMALCPQHLFLLLTKRSGRMRRYFSQLERDECGADRGKRMTRAVNAVFRDARTHWGGCGSTSTHITTVSSGGGAMETGMLRSTAHGGVERLIRWTEDEERWGRCGDAYAANMHKVYGEFEYPRQSGWGLKCWPLPNVVLGVSVEDQVRADERREHLKALAAQGWLTFVSYEPALGFVDWSGWEWLSWLVSGCETGPKARPSHPGWHRAARDFCAKHNIAYFFKKHGVYRAMAGEACTAKQEPFSLQPHRNSVYAAVGAVGYTVEFLHKVGAKQAGRDLDGCVWEQMPSAFREGAWA
jgi:protein gp37